MRDRFVHVGWRQQQQEAGLYTSEIWNYYGVEFNVSEARRRGFLVEKVYINLKDRTEEKVRQACLRVAEIFAGDWQPIETAPKDGTRVRIKFKSGREAEGNWQTTYGGEWHVDSFQYLPWSEPPVEWCAK